MTVKPTKPDWLRVKAPQWERVGTVKEILRDLGLNTVCEEASCPNIGECFNAGTATFLIMGPACTRACPYCDIDFEKKPKALDPQEPENLAEAVRRMKLNHVVITSVNRDDLPDGGAGCFADTLRALRLHKPDMGVEFLTPDFRRVQQAAADRFNATLAALPDGARKDLIWGHNLETVPRLYKEARKGARYERSLNLLALAARQPGVEAKSALMLGLGETRAEVMAVLADLRGAGVQRLCLGQYLRPTLAQLPVARYVPPEEFAEYEAAARELGFTWVKAGPLVRSSYHAEEIQHG